MIIYRREMQAQYVVTIMTGSTPFSSTICVGPIFLPALFSTQHYLIIFNCHELNDDKVIAKQYSYPPNTKRLYAFGFANLHSL